MTDTRGTFRLKEVRQDILNNEYISMPSIYVGENQNVGYTKCYNQFQYKLNFSTEVSTVTTHQPVIRLSPTATSNPTHAWYIGGEYSPSGNPGYVTDSQKITYATDTAADNPSSRLPGPRAAVGGLSGQSHSYLMGGIPYTLTTVSKLTYANDTTVDLPGSHLSAAVYNVQSGTAGGASGYIFAGGTSDYSETQRITFSNDTRTTLPSSSRMDPINENGSGDGVPYWGAGKMQCSTHCYYAGGNPSGGNFTSTFQKLTFSNETWAVNPSKMARPIRNMGGFTASPTQGAIAGGQTTSGGTSSVDFVTFETDTWATSPSMTLSPSPGGTAGAYYNQVSTTTIHDSLHSGTPGIPLSIRRWIDNTPEPLNTAYGTAGSSGASPVYKFDFATTTSTLPFGTVSGYLPGATQSTQRYRQATLSSSDAGYMSGGTTYIPGNTAVSIQDKLTYSNDTTVRLPSANLATPKLLQHSGISDGTTAGWYWCGNNYPSYNTTSLYKITFSTDAASTSPTQLASGTYAQSSTNSATAGYTFGGHSYRYNSNKLQFSTESASLLPSTMPGAMSSSGSSSTGNQIAGYVGSGNPSSTRIMKVSWATETGVVLPSSGTLSASRGQTYCVGNTTDGFWCGGSPGGNARIDNLNYATDTGSNVPSWSPSPMAGSVYYGWGVGARNAGIPVATPPPATPTPSKAPGPSFNGALWMGGYQTDSTVVSSGGKIEFSTDTVTELPSAHLTGNRYNLAATASIEAGYYGNAQTTQVVKVTYGTETPSVLPGGLSGGPGSPSPGNDPRRRGCSFGPKTVGYMMQGSTGYSGSLSNFDKIVYSTEVISRLPGSNCPYSTYATAGTSNQTTGYATQGAASSNIGKLPFATESWSTIPGWNAWDAKAISNTTHGFWIGAKSNGAGSEVYKFNYSNDTGARLPGSNHPNQWNIYGWGSGNSTDGWTSGGAFNQGSSYTTSNFYKMAYSNDTWSTSPSTTSNRKSKNAASGARQNGIGDEQATGVTPVLI